MVIWVELFLHKPHESNANWHCTVAHGRLCYSCLLSGRACGWIALLLTTMAIGPGLVFEKLPQSLCMSKYNHLWYDLDSQTCGLDYAALVSIIINYHYFLYSLVAINHNRSTNKKTHKYISTYGPVRHTTDLFYNYIINASLLYICSILEIKYRKYILYCVLLQELTKSVKCVYISLHNWHMKLRSLILVTQYLNMQHLNKISLLIWYIYILLK